MNYFIGLDGGGSHTRAIFVDEDRNVLGRAETGPANYLRVGIGAATAALTGAIIGAANEADKEVRDIAWAYCGIAGSDHPVHRNVLVDALRTVLDAGKFTVDTDARIALEGAIGPRPGIVVISGTGSVAFGRNRGGDEARAGGWGPTLGDEGSGYAIARAGLTAIVRASDGRGPGTVMTRLLCEGHGLCSPNDLRYFIYSEESDASRIAKLNRVVVDAALEGDHVAREILDAAGHELALSAIAVAKTLRMIDDSFSVSYIGGAFKAGDLLLDPFIREMVREAPGCEVHAPLAEPVAGAASLAVQTWKSGGRVRN